MALVKRLSKYWSSVSFGLILLVVDGFSSTTVNPYNFEFVINQPRCESDVRLLVVVHSSPKRAYSLRRHVLRLTWLKRSFLERELGLKTRILFFMGSSVNTGTQKRIQYENELYRDIVQSDFIDKYQHNTYKAMSYLHWVSKYCSHAGLIMKVDDDALIQPERFKKLRLDMHTWIGSQYALYKGKAIENYQIVNRDPEKKWYISEEVWPEEVFPLWFQGLIYFLTPSSASELFKLAQVTPYMYTDDVFVGVLMRTLQKRYVMQVSSEPDLSLFAYSNQDDVIEGEMLGFWLEGNITAFHVPNLKTYIEWSSSHYLGKDDDRIVRRTWFRTT